MSDEEARAERKRRQRQAQEEFRLKQLMKSSHDTDDRVDKQELHKSSFDNLLLGIPTQDIHIEESGVSADKRKSPEPGGGAAKRRASAVGRLDIVTD
ncbi:hypothetical protein JYU34_014739 [Plutella xylostella]|uniref:Uncharacterized protein n=1 Tax=Plutella xylostella TaxID=51655 RepID=A0ABQ7Q940_PLUXY|nr:hypothetical protein JYU34_014739 [Plutella xylostella]